VPPIMGAAAFIMAELTGISYWNIALAAILPAFLYYVAVYSVVHYEAIKMGLQASAGDRKTIMISVAKKGYMFAPVVVILYFLGTGHSISMSAMMAILSCFVISAIPIVYHGKWKELMVFVRALEDGARNSVSVAVPCALAGIIVGVLTLSALGLKFTGMILGFSQGNVVIILILTSLICLILGMGMPTSAAYITVAVMAIPSLIKAGLTPITAHFFGFYFANLSMITPPVALAAYAGAGIAGANSSDVGLKACYLGAVIYFIPFLFATYPSLLLVGSWPEILLGFIKCSLIVLSFCTCFMGFFGKKLNAAERLLFLVAGVSLWGGRLSSLLDLLGILAFLAGTISNLKGKSRMKLLNGNA
jgi:TRAP transporter 4TM/12TM fusion protein